MSLRISSLRAASYDRLAISAACLPVHRLRFAQLPGRLDSQQDWTAGHDTQLWLTMHESRQLHVQLPQYPIPARICVTALHGDDVVHYAVTRSRLHRKVLNCPYIRVLTPDMRLAQVRSAGRAAGRGQEQRRRGKSGRRGEGRPQAPQQPQVAPAQG